jgi:multidrug efflux pump subunit AcrA (membrane-fusion protein)
MRLSPLIPWWLTATVALAAGVALGGGLQQIRVANAQAALADARARHADTLRQTAEAARLFRATEAEWRNRIDKETQDGQTRIDTARADALTARAAADSLRAQLDAYRRAAPRAAEDPGAAGAGPSEPGADPLDLLAGLLARHSGELVEVGAFADELHARGLTCERASDALSRGAGGG